MRMFGLIGLVLALVIVGMLAKKQLGAAAIPTLPMAPSAQAETPASVAAPTVRAQSQQLQQDIKKSLDAAMQQPRLPAEDN